MNNKLFARLDWHPASGTLIAGGFVVLGFILAEINWAFISLAALGTFGPGILREMGILNDQDEFQRIAARKAGYHAFLVAGLFTFLMVAYIRSGDRNLAAPESVVQLVLAVLWFTWFLSSLLAYWGAQRTVNRVLIAFGVVWLIFNIVGNLMSPVAMFMQCLLAVPFFLLAYVAKSWPRIAGLLLVLAACFFFYFFGLYEIFGPNPLERGRGEVIVLFIGPLLASGIILLRNKVEAGEA